MKRYILYTIGHSNISFDNFYQLLNHFEINCIIDVRSVPYSSYSVHFNKENLKKLLNQKQILYLHFGNEFGARPLDKKMYNSENQVDFEKMIQRPIFQQGVHRLKKGLEKNYNIALMCGCSQPIVCHRFFMISKYLSEVEFFEVRHIFPYKKTLYRNFITDKEPPEIKIQEQKNELNYFVRLHRDLENFDKKDFNLDLFESHEERYFKDRNQKTAYKLNI